LAWELEENGIVRRVTAQDLLARTVFYKVANHGSENAFEERSLEAMTCPDLVAGISVDKAFAHKLGFGMPAPVVYSRLLDMTRGRLLRPDFDGLKAVEPRNPPPDPNFYERIRVTPLYVDYCIL